MKLNYIEVIKLFGSYNHKINFKKNEMVTILHAPNGYGKTTILKLVKAIVEGDILFLDDTPFESVNLYFDNKETIKVKKDEVFASLFDKDIIDIRNRIAHTTENVKIPIYYEISKEKYDISINRDILMPISRRYSTRYSRIIGEEEYTISFRNVLIKESLEREIFENSKLFEKLDVYEKSLQIHIIESNRLFQTQQNENYSIRERNSDRTNMIDTIKVYSQELKNRITEVRNRIGNLSDEMDRSFPNRVLDTIISGSNDNVLSEEEIRNSLNELEDKRKKLEILGLINEGQTTKIPQNSQISIDARKILSVYVEDNHKKLSVYDDIKNKIDLLLEIINLKNGFSNKKMKIDRDNGVLFILDNGKEIPLEKLSSGEKNDFILFYELLFKCKKNSIILIDEPEISLHIAWQQEFIRELLEICKLNDMQALVATHSPNIVDEYWDLLVDLEEV